MAILRLLDEWHCEMEAEELAEEWETYHALCESERLLTRSAKRRLKEGDQTLWLQLQETKKRWPNLPPHQRICVSNPWG